MEYYKLIAILEAQIEKQIQPDTEFIPNEHSLTLKRLLVWTQESLQRMKWMSALVDMGKGREAPTEHRTCYELFVYRSKRRGSDINHAQLHLSRGPLFQAICQ